MNHAPRRHHDDPDAPKSFLQRVDRLAGDMNAFLLLLALGLAGLDLSCFVALKVAQMPVMQTSASTALTPAGPMGTAAAAPAGAAAENAP